MVSQLSLHSINVNAEKLTTIPHNDNKDLEEGRFLLWRNSKTLETTGVVIVTQMTVPTLAYFKLCMRAYDVTTNGTTS